MIFEVLSCILGCHAMLSGSYVLRFWGKIHTQLHGITPQKTKMLLDKLNPLPANVSMADGI
jgi:hypothetical protein